MRIYTKTSVLRVIPEGFVRGLMTGTMLVPILQPYVARSQTIGPGAITTTVNVPSGTTTVVGNTTISTAGTTSATNVTGTGTLVLDTQASGFPPGPILVQSVNGHALLVNSNSGRITIPNGASISTTGLGAGLAAIGGTIDATGVVVNNTGSSVGHGAIAQNGGTIELHAGTSITTGASNATLGNSVGLGASQAGSSVVADTPISVTMNGRGAMGIYMHNGGLVSLSPGSTLQMNGTSSVGVTVDNTAVPLGTLGRGLTINLAGTGASGQAGSTGIVALNGGSIAIADVTITGANAAAGAWARANSSIALSGQSVINVNAAQNPTSYTLTSTGLVTVNGSVASTFSVTSATPNSGLLAINAGSSITSTGTTINVNSSAASFSTGVEAANGGIIDLTNNTITTTSPFSSGIRVDSNGTVIGRDSQVTTSGGDAALRVNSAPGTIDLTNTTVQANGPGTVGLVSLNSSSGSVNNVSLSGGSLISAQSTAVEAQGPLNLTVSNGAVVTGGGGRLLQTFANSGPQPTAVEFTASGGSILTGDAVVDASSTANLALLTGSRWTGASFNMTNVTVDPTSTWNMTASSTVSQQVTNAGLIDITPPAGGIFKTLTTRNYVGQGGTLGLNTFLGSDGSPSDKLVIDGGTATGNSILRITNAGGGGALTTANGILVVETINSGTTASGAFRLTGEVRAGIFDYDLFRGGINGSDPNDWFLRSDFIVGPGPGPGPIFPPNELPPDPPLGPLPPGTYPIIGPEIATYGVVQPIARQLGLTTLGTLHERAGDTLEESCSNAAANVVAPAGAASAAPDGRCKPGLWGRVFGASINNSYQAFADPRATGQIAGIQTGFDFFRGSLIPGHLDTAGVYLAYGNAHVDVDGLVTNPAATAYVISRTGTVGLNAYSGGAYWTHYGPTGWYFDLVLQGTGYDGSATTQFANLPLTGSGFTSSLEAGYPIPLPWFGPRFVLEPQGQIIWQQVAFKDTNDSLGPVGLGTTSGTTGRLGLRGRWTIVSPNGMVWQPYVRANVWRDWGAEATTTFGADFAPLIEQSTRLEFAGGVTAKLGTSLSLYAQGGYQFATSESGAYGFRRDSIKGDVGVRYTW